MWDTKKNEKLKAERDISFEDVLYYIERGNLLDIVEHPNQTRYQGQKIFVVAVKDYVYLVPFIEGEKEIVLKSIIPSRKATKHYLRGGKRNG